jgi:hypothetical protein
MARGALGNVREEEGGGSRVGQSEVGVKELNKRGK